MVDQSGGEHTSGATLRPLVVDFEERLADLAAELGAAFAAVLMRCGEAFTDELMRSVFDSVYERVMSRQVAEPARARWLGP